MSLIVTNAWQPYKESSIKQQNAFSMINEENENNLEDGENENNLEDEDFNDFINNLEIDTNEQEWILSSNTEGCEINIKTEIAKDLSQQIINYDNYKEEPIEDFYDAIWNKNKRILLQDITHLNTVSEEMLFKTKFEQYFEQATINLFQQQTENQTDSYFFYIKLVDILESLKNQEEYMQDFQMDDELIKEIIKNIKMKEFSEEEQLQLSNIENNNEQTEIKKIKELLDSRIPMISVNKIQEFSVIAIEENQKIPVHYILKYHEIQYKPRDMTNNVYKILITGPVGTAFLINHEPKLFYITDYLDQFSACVLDGKYELDTEGYVPINYITFPQLTVPELKLKNEVSINGRYQLFGEENKTIDPSQYQITITIYYNE